MKSCSDILIVQLCFLFAAESSVPRGWIRPRNPRCPVQKLAVEAMHHLVAWDSSVTRIQLRVTVRGCSFAKAFSTSSCHCSEILTTRMGRIACIESVCMVHPERVIRRDPEYCRLLGGSVESL